MIGAWHALSIGMLISLPAHAQWWVLPNEPGFQQQDESIVSYSCVTSGAPIYLPGCSEDDYGVDCSFRAGETIKTAVLLDKYHTAAAVGLSPKAVYSEHRYWRVWISDTPDDGYDDVAPACRDESEPGDLNPRINFQPIYVRGCPQPEDMTWLNVEPVGAVAGQCGTYRRCATVVYGP